MKNKLEIKNEELYYKKILESYKEKIEALRLLDDIKKIYLRGGNSWKI